MRYHVKHRYGVTLGRQVEHRSPLRALAEADKLGDGWIAVDEGGRQIMWGDMDKTWAGYCETGERAGVNKGRI